MKTVIKHLALLTALGVASGANASVITNATNSTPIAVCDLCTVTSTIKVKTQGFVDDVNVLVNNLTHSWDGDLVISLSHGDTSVTLYNRQGGSDDTNLIGTVFDDQAGMSITAGNAYGPYTGAFRPYEALSAFVGKEIYGAWTLTVTDSEAGDDGVLNNWGLNLKSTQIVPEPGSLGLLGLGLLALGLKVRRNRA